MSARKIKYRSGDWVVFPGNDSPTRLRKDGATGFMHYQCFPRFSPSDSSVSSYYVSNPDVADRLGEHHSWVLAEDVRKATKRDFELSLASKMEFLKKINADINETVFIMNELYGGS